MYLVFTRSRFKVFTRDLCVLCSFTLHLLYLSCTVTTTTMKSALQTVASRHFSTTKHLLGLQSTLKGNFYNSEQVALQQSVKQLVEEVINPHAEQWDRDKIFPAREVYKKFGDAGLLGIHRPTEYGGQGLSYKGLSITAIIFQALKVIRDSKFYILVKRCSLLLSSLLLENNISIK